MSCTPRSGSKRRPGNVCHAKTITSSPYKKTLENSERQKKRSSSQSTGKRQRERKRMHTGKIKSNCNSGSALYRRTYSVRRGLMVIQSTTRRVSTAKSPMISRQCSGGSVVAVRCGLVDVTVRTWAERDCLRL